MVGKRKHRRKAAYEGDPLVPVQVGVLEAAMMAAGIGETELAELVGDGQATISALLHPKGKTKRRRARAGRVRRIAEVLQVPLEWLTEGIAFAPAGPLAWKGFEYRYSVRTEFAASRLFTRCLTACERDLAAGSVSMRRGYSRQALVGHLVSLIAELVQIGRWRHWLLQWDATAVAERNNSEPASTPGGAPSVDPSHEAAILGLCRGIEHVLAPWFEGQAKLNYVALARLTWLPGEARLLTGADPFTPAAALTEATSKASTVRVDQAGQVRRPVKKGLSRGRIL